MFSIGIGQGAYTSLVTGIARAGNGKAEFVYGTDRLQAKVRDTYVHLHWVQVKTETNNFIIFSF